MAITRTTWTDGSTVLNNARLQAIYAAIESGWALDTYTPTWTASSVNPSLGNGTVTGSYINIGGKCVVFAAKIAMGSTTTYGTGQYAVSLPLTANSGFPGVIAVFAQDSSASGAVHNGSGFISTSTTASLFLTTEAAGVAPGGYTATTPITFASGDIIHVFGVYFRS